MGDFKSLRAWQESRRLAELSADAITRLPPHERYALAPQWRRAAYSVSLNLAEGTGRRGPKEFRRYLDFALGSLHEIEAILELIEGLGYLSAVELAALKVSRANCARMVFGLIRMLKKRDG
jgi:four helix bundle protein